MPSGRSELATQGTSGLLAPVKRQIQLVERGGRRSRARGTCGLFEEDALRELGERGLVLKQAASRFVPEFSSVSSLRSLAQPHHDGRVVGRLTSAGASVTVDPSRDCCTVVEVATALTALDDRRRNRLSCSCLACRELTEFVTCIVEGVGDPAELRTGAIDVVPMSAAVERLVVLGESAL